MSKHPILQRLEAHGWQTNTSRPNPAPADRPVSDEVANRYGNAALDRATQAVATAVNGTRNHTLNTEAYGIGRIANACGIPEDLIVDKLTDAARTCGLDDREIGTVLPRAIRDGMADPRHIPDREEAPPATVIEPDPLDVEIFNGFWLDQQKFQELRWAVRGILTEGLGVLAGAPKVGKSWFGLAVLLAKATGSPALGCIDTEPGPVLYLALEDGKRRLQDRARKLLDGKPIPANIDFIIKGNPIQLEEAVREWLGKHRGENPLVVIDTLQKMRPASTPGVSAYELDYRHVSRLKVLADDHPGSTVLLVHHTRKDKGAGDFLEAVSGTFGISGAADYTVVLTRNRQENTGLLAVTGRDVHEAEYQLTNEDGNWILTGGSLDAAAKAAQDGMATRNLGDDAAAVVQYASDHGPVTPKQVEAAVDLPGTTVRSYLTRAVDAGRLQKHGRGRYGPVATATSATTVEADPSKVAHVAQATDPHNVLPFDRSTE